MRKAGPPDYYHTAARRHVISNVPQHIATAAPSTARQISPPPPRPRLRGNADQRPKWPVARRCDESPPRFSDGGVTAAGRTGAVSASPRRGWQESFDAELRSAFRQAAARISPAANAREFHADSQRRRRVTITAQAASGRDSGVTSRRRAARFDAVSRSRSRDDTLGATAVRFHMHAHGDAALAAAEILQ